MAKRTRACTKGSPSLSRLEDHGALLLVLLHDGLLVVALPQAGRQDLHARVVDLLPPVETPALTHGPDAPGAHVVHVVEEHLVPAVAATQQERHERMHSGPRAVGVCR